MRIKKAWKRFLAFLPEGKVPWLILTTCLVLGAFTFGVMVGITKAPQRRAVDLANAQEILEQHEASEQQAAEEASRVAAAQERETAELKNEKLNEFLEGTQERGTGLVTIPFETGTDVALNESSWWKRTFNPRTAIITDEDLDVLLQMFEDARDVEVKAHIPEQDHIVVTFEPAQ